ncbi:unnamed protein product [Brassica rapa]|uniref:Uncharacterized protein n=1 Tax=Brassica campestris TaxID=3711 RepID=A0A8D9G0P8_BRACM|nr:unnamed protein product [Brassica rapa]
MDKQSCVNGEKVHPGEAVPRFSETERDKAQASSLGQRRSSSLGPIHVLNVLDRGFAKVSTRLSVGYFGSSARVLKPTAKGPRVDLLIPNKATKP